MKLFFIIVFFYNLIVFYVKLCEVGVRCYLGVDNINDLFMLIVDGDMWMEV